MFKKKPERSFRSFRVWSSGSWKPQSDISVPGQASVLLGGDSVLGGGGSGQDWCAKCGSA